MQSTISLHTPTEKSFLVNLLIIVPLFHEVSQVYGWTSSVNHSVGNILPNPAACAF